MLKLQEPEALWKRGSLSQHCTHTCVSSLVRRSLSAPGITGLIGALARVFPVLFGCALMYIGAAL